MNSIYNGNGILSFEWIISKLFICSFFEQKFASKKTKNFQKFWFIFLLKIWFAKIKTMQKSKIFLIIISSEPKNARNKKIRMLAGFLYYN